MTFPNDISVRQEIPAGQLECTVHGILAVYDLPDLVNLAGKEKIRFVRALKGNAVNDSGSQALPGNPMHF